MDDQTRGMEAGTKAYLTLVEFWISKLPDNHQLTQDQLSRTFNALYRLTWKGEGEPKPIKGDGSVTFGQVVGNELKLASIKITFTNDRFSLVGVWIGDEPIQLRDCLRLFDWKSVLIPKHT